MGKLSKVADSFSSRPTIDIAGALASLFSSTPTKKKRRPGHLDQVKNAKIDSIGASAPKIEQLPLWKADKQKSEIRRMFDKGLITKTEAARRLTKTEAGHEAYMQALMNSER